MRCAWPLLVVWGALAACASTVATAPADGGLSDAADGARDVTVAPDDVESVSETAADAVCSALFRCCGAEGRARYFAPLEFNDRVPRELMGSIPPTDEASCRRVVAEVLRVAVFPDWIDAVRRGQAEYVPEGSLACRRALANAPCGDLLTNALLDRRCFSLSDSAFLGRSMFRPVAREGDACRTVREARFSAWVYGSCDPAAAYCCLPAPTDPQRCIDFFEAEQLGVTEGTCRPTAAQGEACTGRTGSDTSLHPCARDHVCGLSSRVCLTSDYETELGLDQLCYDPTEGRLLGRCPYERALSCDSYRLTGEGDATLRCILLSAAGSACGRNSECLDFRCVEGVCRATRPLCGEP